MYHFIFLAAGFSRRFNGNKLLTSYRGKELYRHLLDRLTELTCERNDCDLTVVTQYREIYDHAVSHHIRCVINPDPGRGQSSSICCGTGLFENDRKSGDYFMYFTGDQPFLTKASLIKFMEEMEQRRKLIGAYELDGRYRNPAAFSTDLYEELMALKGDGGARTIFKNHPRDIFGFTDFDPLELVDLDLREDFLTDTSVI